MTAAKYMRTEKHTVQRRTAAAALLAILPLLLVGLPLYLGLNTGLILLAALLPAALGIMFLRPQATTLVVLFVLYANLSVVAVRSYAVPEFVAAAFFVTLLLPLAHYVVVDRQPVVLTPIFTLMLVYLGVMFVSAVVSGNAMDSLDRLLSYAVEGMLLYLLIVNTVRTPAILRGGIWAIVLAGVLMGSLSLYQNATQGYDNDFGGLALTKETGTIDTGQLDAWGNDIEQRRASGPIGSKNRYAQIMVVLLPIALTLIWAERNKWLRGLAALSCIPIVGGALLTYSRGAGITIVAVLLVMALLGILKMRHLALLVVTGCLLVLLAVPTYVYRISTAGDVAKLVSGDTDQASGSVRGRATENLAAIGIFLDHPFLGVGPGQTSKYTAEYGNEVGYRRLVGERRAHNMFFEELSDNGAIGFAVFMGIVAVALRQLYRLYRGRLARQPQVAYMAAGLLLAIVAWLITGVFLHLSYIRYFWLIVALAGAAVEIYKNGNVTSAGESGTYDARVASLQRSSWTG